MTDMCSPPLGHAYIVASPDAALRERAAVRLAAAMVCTGENKPCMACAECRRVLGGIHPDVITVERLTDDSGKRKKEIQVAQIRSMSADAWVRPSQADRKVYIIREAGKMNMQAQNAALKTLEEPPVYAAFILCADNASELLPTVRSRCVTISPGGGEAAAENPAADEYLLLAQRGDALGLCEFFIRCESMSSEQFDEFVEASKQSLSEIICRRKSGLDVETAGRLLEVFERAGECLRANVGAKHVCGMLCALTE